MAQFKHRTMNGMRPLEDEEIEKIREWFSNKPEDKAGLDLRNKTLFFFQMYTGWRISEVLSLVVGDVVQYGKIGSMVKIAKRFTKKKVASRIGIINDACSGLLNDYFVHYHLFDDDMGKPLFHTRNGTKMSPRSCQKIYKVIFTECELPGINLSTHSCRKTFARKVYAASGENLVKLQTALGHENIDSTRKYIGDDVEKVKEIIKNLEF